MPKRKPKEPPTYADILKLQFEAIGEVYTAEAVASPDWFLKKSWTDEQQESFRKKFRVFIKKHYPGTDIEIAYAFWDLQYGWRNAT